MTLGSSSVRSGGVERDLLRPGDIREMNVKILCVQCNSRWMEPIEKAAAPILESIMRGEAFPPARDLFRLAHWSTVVGALATQTGSRFDVPVEHRRKIRYTTTGQPQDFGTHFIWTLDTYPGARFDFMRFETGSDAEERGVSWYSSLHAGPLVMISAECTVNTMIARELHHSGIESYLGTVSGHLLCIPDAIRSGRRQSSAGLVSASHHTVEETYRKVAGPDVEYVDTHGGSLVSIDEWRWRHPEKFHYGDTLVDMRSQLDLSYLDGVFES
ncbi:hypothetical protein C5E45_20325 [Nocardia nova]|uniref:Uncharacterized protein n=2 Tax=Nocardia nova TaxID=37330 RepID=A0A2S6AMF1_9NOCA|nr:hypothetical protein C5E45_20325 [Nocardia nova]